MIPGITAMKMKDNFKTNVPLLTMKKWVHVANQIYFLPLQEVDFIPYFLLEFIIPKKIVLFPQ